MNPSKLFYQSRLLISKILIYISIISISCISEKREKIVDELKLEIELGKKISEKLLSRYIIYKNIQLTRELNKFTNYLKPYISREYVPLKVGIIDSNEVFAFSLPGGYIYVSKGTIKNCDNSLQLASLMSHEIAHVDLNHSLGNKHSDEENIVINLVPGAGLTSAMQELINNISDEILTKGRSVDTELEADEYAIQLLNEMKLPNNGLVEFFKKVDKLNPNLIKTNSNTHPSLKLRIAKMEKLVHANHNFKSNPDWEALNASFKKIKEKL